MKRATLLSVTSACSLLLASFLVSGADQSPVSRSQAPHSTRVAHEELVSGTLQHEFTSLLTTSTEGSADSLSHSQVGVEISFNNGNGPRNTFPRAIEVQEQHTGRLLKEPGVVGTAVGVDDADEPVIHVYVENPGQGKKLESTLDGVPVQVIVTGKLYGPDAPDKGKPTATRAATTGVLTRPVPIGASTGNAGECLSGTIGCRLKDPAGNVYAISCNHVYARQNKAPLGSAILQPGLADTSCTVNLNNQIGTLTLYKALTFGSGSNNLMDAAIALSSTANLGKSTPADGYGTPKTNPVTPAVGSACRKYGRTSGQTNGSIYSVNATVSVNYSSGTATFTKQVVVRGTNFQLSGDSGALLVRSSDNAPIGIMFAANSSRTLSFASPMATILTEFQKTIPGLVIDGN